MRLISLVSILSFFSRYNSAIDTDGTISIIFSSPPFIPQCINNIATVYINLNVQTSVDGLQILQPMQETGLPTIEMFWFVNNQIASLSVIDTFNVNSNNVYNNVWSFQLEDDEPDIGGGFQLGACNLDNFQVSAYFHTESFVIGTGVPINGIPAVSAVPSIVNNLSPENIAPSKALPTTTLPITSSVTTSQTTSSITTLYRTTTKKTLKTTSPVTTLTITSSVERKHSSSFSFIFALFLILTFLQ